MNEEVNFLVGTCKWYNIEKGYGFVTLPGGAIDVFVHRNQLTKSGIKSDPQEGQKLKFVVEKGPKGTYASNISLVE